jgi:hypothetical protein
MLARAGVEIGLAGLLAAAAPPAAEVTPAQAVATISGPPARVVVFEEFTRPT